jgi:hypothetical protein
VLQIPQGISFSDLDISQQGSNTVIESFRDKLSILRNTQANLLTGRNFIFAAVELQHDAASFFSDLKLTDPKYFLNVVLTYAI